ncbi:hypothetical protein JTB14_031049 [Gonioctena quinquepunctata]|nr:hypothetical protein JTB14_031049 [Gonioctena quinquepunctata]
MYLVASKMFDSIEHKFLVVGHSFLLRRNFAIIENDGNLCVQKHWAMYRSVESVLPERPFKVFQMAGTFLDFDKAAESVINTKLCISNVCQIRIDHEQPGLVPTKKTYSILESWEVKPSPLNRMLLSITSGLFLSLLLQRDPSVKQKKGLTDHAAIHL